MAVLHDLENLPSLEEEYLHPAEVALIREWESQSPSLKALVKEKGLGAVGMLARKHLRQMDNEMQLMRAENPEMPIEMIEEMLARERSFLPMGRTE